MKKLMNYFKPAPLILGAILIALTACEKQEGDTCDDSKRTHVEVTFDFTFQIQYADKVPYQGYVGYLIKKTYCSGTVKGRYNKNGVTSATGYWDPGMIYTYKYDNTMDQVDISITAESLSGDTEVIYWQGFMYNEVYLANHVKKTYYLTLPYKSTD